MGEGDAVQIGTVLFEDKKNPGVVYTSPAAGTVNAINRGEKRSLLSVVIDVDGDRSKVFESSGPQAMHGLERSVVVQQLTMSGMWTSLRTRPYSKVPAVDSEPHAIFVTAMDTNPLGVDASKVISDRAEEFALGLDVIAKLTEGAVHVCQKPGKFLPSGHDSSVKVHEFDGPHPAGLPGTHIHFIDPVGPEKTVWYIGYQDVCTIGALFQTGTVDPRRVISLAGPVVKQPRLLETRAGADVSQLIEGEIEDDVKIRPISGSVLSGRTALPPHNYLGRFHTQISVLEEGDEREFLGWQKPGVDKFSTTRVYASAGFPDKKFAFTTTTHGSERAMVPLGTYEKVMPLDILPTQLLRALIYRDTDEAQMLGALELEEEDLALCTFVCPGKYEYGSLLRHSLTTIEREG